MIKAYNGKEAVKLYTEHRPDLTLMDIRMPEMQGDEAIDKIRDMDPEANIIAVTAYNYSEEDLGVQVVRKGFSRVAFIELVEEALT